MAASAVNSCFHYLHPISAKFSMLQKKLIRHLFHNKSDINVVVVVVVAVVVVIFYVPLQLLPCRTMGLIYVQLTASYEEVLIR